MGHERIGFLPRSKQWKAIIEQLCAYDGTTDSVKPIAYQTLVCINSTYKKLPLDESVIHSLRFLATLAVSASKENQIEFLQSEGFNVENRLSVYSILQNANNLITTDGSLEINKIARDAVMQAVMQYNKNHESQQTSLFSETENGIWSEIGNGASFCELTRLFFSAFSSRQLRYYIERTAASSINDYLRLEAFVSNIDEHSAAIADHAFDTSKLVQSFAAGWYNNHAQDKVPSKEEIVAFLRISFNKLREEFRREAEEI